MESLGRVEDICYTVIYGYLAVLTIGGNVLVIAAFCTDRNIRQRVSNYFIVNLAVSDLMCGLFIFTVKFGKRLWSLFQPIDHGEWPFGRTFCTVWIWFGTALIYASLFLVISISVDRYLLVRDAIKYTINVTKTKILIAVAVAWMSSFSYSIFSIGIKLYLELDSDATLEEGPNDRKNFQNSTELELSVLRGDGTPLVISPTGFTDSINTITPYTSDDNDSRSSVAALAESVCTDDVYGSVSNYGLLVALVGLDFLLFFGILATANSCVCFKLTQRARNGIFDSSRGRHQYRVKEDDDTSGHDFPTKSDVTKVTATETNNDDDDDDGSRDFETSRDGGVVVEKVIVKETSCDKNGREQPSSAIRIESSAITRIDGNHTSKLSILQEDNKCKKRRCEKQLREECDSNPQLDRNREKILYRQNRKAVTSLLVLVVVYVICWCPYYVISVLYHSGVLYFNKFLINLALDMTWLNSTINPFLYGATNMRFKKGMVAVLRRIVKPN